MQPSGTTGNTPQAYLTVLFFDERFNFISAADGGAYSQQIASTTGANGSSLTLANIKAPKNGYVYVYVSNRSDQNVYFDNFKVQVQAGNLIEENHYYAYGLKIASISSVKLGDGAEGGLQNNYQYQGAYSELDADIGWNDFELRNYDAQTGRWIQPDPYHQYPSPYVGMGNDPVNRIDPNGGNVLGLTPGLFTLTTTLVGAVAGGGISAASGGSFWKGAAIGAAVGFAAGYIPSLVGGGVSISLNHAISIFSMSVKAVGVARNVVQMQAVDKSFNQWSAGYANASNRVHGPMVDMNAWDDGGGGDGGGDQNKLRGGKQKDRDKEIKKYPKDFQRWYHREIKPDVHPDRDATPEELADEYENWQHLGKPTVKAVGIGVGIAILVYEGIKWAAAAALAPETLGVSLGVAATTP